MKKSGFRKQSYQEKLAKLAVKRVKQASKPKLPKPKKKRTARRIRRIKGMWATTTADNYFSKWIRERDQVCQRCGTPENLTCSHYHRRAISITRYCPINCSALCSECHQEWEGPKEEYTNLMIERLGMQGFIELMQKAGRTQKRSDAVAECKKLLTM